MNTFDALTLRRNAQELRRRELARIARSIAIKWQTYVKVRHGPHPSKIPTPSHP
jgi:hypothetical protein